MNRLKRLSAIAAVAAFALGCAIAPAIADDAALRPPAVPLVTADPYLSIWSEADHLTDKNTQHWTHHDNSLISLIRIDGVAYRLMGADPSSVPAMPQTSLQVLPTRSIYNFENSNIHVTLTFMTAALPHDLNVMTRPLSYITWEVRSVDGKSHAVSIYDSTSSQLAVNEPTQAVDWRREKMGKLTAMRVGTVDQTLLTPAGDDTRIDWGYAYAAAPLNLATAAIGGNQELLADFVSSGTLPAKDDSRMPRPVNDDQPVMALAFDLGNVNSAPVSRHVIVAYDEIYSIKFAGKNLRPYWRRNGATPSDLLQSAERDYPSLMKRCTKFDTDLMADMTKVGGNRYAQIAALAYRQCLAANGYAADSNKQLLMFTKENTSNGDIATVDVIFPQDPMLLLFSSTLAKASLVPVLDYAMDPRWKFPNAPHDLGTYPNARASGDQGEGMPVEESGNMLILCDAISQMDGNTDFAAHYWPKLTQWAEYLQQYGLDPEDQLCTDDFMGHLAHNANLSVKAILALAAYGDMCRMKGDTAGAAKYAAEAKTDAAHWVKVADAGDHSLLAFDKPGTWSQKYNLVWDKILSLNVFPPEVAQKEVAYYKTVMQQYGVPLDSRTHLTKTDWSVWSATLADNQADFETLVSPIYDYLNNTTTRDPLSDSYVTDNIKSGGMHARPVVGGIFIKMLSDRAMWKKWSSGEKVKGANWAPLPPAPIVTQVVPTEQTWSYTTDKPADDWTSANFDDSTWAKGQAGFGNAPNLIAHTPWTTSDIWIRRTLTVPADVSKNLQFYVYHDEDIDIYVNGVFAAKEAGYVNGYEPLAISDKARALLKPGATVTIAAHCHQTEGGQGIDIGLANVVQK